MLGLLFISLLLVPQPEPPESTCKKLGGYEKPAGQVCLLPEDMSADQALLFKDLRRAEQELTQALHTQRDFRPDAVVRLRAAFNARIAELEISRDSTTGRPQQLYQDQINRFRDERDRLDSTKPGSPRDKASKLGPTVSRLNIEINELKRDLNASIP